MVFILKVTARKLVAPVVILGTICVFVWASRTDCQDGARLAKIACKGVLSAVTATGALVNAIIPGTTVLVELDNGRIVPGLVTARAATGRNVEVGDLVRLDCTAQVATRDPRTNTRLCRLQFLRKNYAGSRYPSDNEFYGIQSEWNIAVDGNGIPDASLLQLKP